MNTTMNPTDVVLRPVVRFMLYIIGSIGSIVVAYTTAKGWTGDAEIVAWGGVVAIIHGLAAANVPSRPRLRRIKGGDPVVRDEGGYVDPRVTFVIAVVALALALILLFADNVVIR